MTVVIVDEIVLDMRAAVADAKERLGYSRVVLAGWSGGGSLSLLYQEQAEAPSITATPWGDPPDLSAAELIPADAVMLLAAHPSRHAVPTDSFDPAIVDASDPELRDPRWDLYGPDAPTPPYDREWLAGYRAAQEAATGASPPGCPASWNGCATPVAQTRSAGSSSMGRWPIQPCSTARSTRTIARSACPTWVTRSW